MSVTLVIYVVAFLAIAAAILGLAYHTTKGSFHAQFSTIFHERITETNPICYGRDHFKRDLQEYLNRPNPLGIIFVSGSKNAGKTTAIKSALKGREHVAYISLRDKKFETELDLVNHLKASFKITQFSDFLQNWNVGWLSYAFGFNSLFKPFSGDYAKLDEILTEIESILEYAYRKQSFYPSLSNRPVIFIDEIGNLQPMVNGNDVQRACAKKFVNWVIKITKDMMLSDVIFSSHDGFSMETLSLADTLYTSSVTMPHFTVEEIQNITQKHSGLNGKYAKWIIDEVGTLGSHVIDALHAPSADALDVKIKSYAVKERETLEEIERRAAKESWIPWPSRRRPWGTYTIAEFNCVMDKFMEERQNKNTSMPTVGLRTMVEDRHCSKDVIKYLSNEGWVLYDPALAKLQARNKIFLDAYEHKHHKGALVRRLQWELQKEKRKGQSGDDYDFEVPDVEKIKRLTSQLEEL